MNGGKGLKFVTEGERSIPGKRKAKKLGKEESQSLGQMSRPKENLFATPSKSERRRLRKKTGLKQAGQGGNSLY